MGLALLTATAHAIAPAAQWGTRFLHGYRKLEGVRAFGANVVNVHHATPINPYINEPFLRPAEIKGNVDHARAPPVSR